ncbi:MAG: hypothetical protein JW982_06395 [Spirochaetes bacterium]|nr:hypothetical protein [Spirochaetota bacterium]
MTEEMKVRKIEASKEDRERLFKVTDVYAITNNRGLSEKQIDELEECKNKWRDMTSIKGYPDIDFPLSIPSWLKNPYFASCWKKGDKEAL